MAQYSNNNNKNNTWTKYIPPNKRNNKKNSVKKNDVDLFNPDMFPCLNDNVNNEKNYNNDNNENKTLNNYTSLFNDDEPVNVETEEDKQKKNMLTLTKENIKKYKEEKDKKNEDYENNLELFNKRANQYFKEIVNREEERCAILEDLYGKGYINEYIVEDLPYYTTTDEEDENTSLSSYEDYDEYYDEFI